MKEFIDAASKAAIVNCARKVRRRVGDANAAALIDLSEAANRSTEMLSEAMNLFVIYAKLTFGKLKSSIKLVTERN